MFRALRDVVGTYSKDSAASPASDLFERREEVLHLALLCVHVYGNDCALSGGWAVSSRAVPGLTKVLGSYVSELYERDGHFALAFAGTADMDDAVDDVLQLVGKSAQHDTAVTNAAVLVGDVGLSKVLFVGHSLGGGLAAAAALTTGARAVTFNPAWLAKKTVTRHGLDKAAVITNHVIMGEALDAAQRFGQNYANTAARLLTDTIAPTGHFVFYESPLVLDLPKGPLEAHRMNAVMDALKSSSPDALGSVKAKALEYLLKSKLPKENSAGEADSTKKGSESVASDKNAGEKASFKQAGLKIMGALSDLTQKKKSKEA